MQRELAISLAEWDMNLANQLSVSDVDSLVSSFNAHVNTALSKSLTIKKKRGRTQIQSWWHSKIFRLTFEENAAFQRFNRDDIPLSETLVLRSVWRKCKTRFDRKDSSFWIRS